jgi:predicted metal-dependent phosphoesterase TrpH
MKIDLQIHTNHSDGRDTVEEVVSLAKTGGVDIIAIADHDLVSAVSIAKDEAGKVGMTVVPGIEITTGYRGQPIHILGYCIDTEHPDLLAFINGINDYRREYFIGLMPEVNKNLVKGGRPEIDIERYKDKQPKYYSYPGVALFLYEEGVVDNRNDGFAYFAGLNDVAPNVEPKEAFEVIHKAGGKAFLSHPLAPKISLKNVSETVEEQEQIVMEFKQQGMDGLECYSTGHAPEDIAYALSLADKHDLLISAGSDWHGCLSKTGEGLKGWLPFYLEKIGDLAVPEEHVVRILKGLGIEI